MGSSRRIALPLAIALHLLLLVLLSRQSVLMRPIEKARRSLTVQLIPLLLPKAQVVPVPVPATRRQDAASTGKPKNHPSQPASSPETLTSKASVPIVETPEESTKDSNPAFGDPAALVKSYSYENSKSDLQKSIESHGGTVALTKGKYDDFHEQMDFATVPDCMKPDALKHDRPKIGPITVVGEAALLFYAHAIITGKCKLPGAN